MRAQEAADLSAAVLNLILKLHPEIFQSSVAPEPIKTFILIFVYKKVCFCFDFETDNLDVLKCLLNQKDMYTDVGSIQKMFASNPLAGFRNPQYPGYAQYFGQGHGSDGKMPCALTFTGKSNEIMTNTQSEIVI